MTLLPGRATPEGTARYASRHAQAAPGHFRELDGLRLSSLGLGTYLGADDDATDRLYEAAVARALDLGLNVLDTAINYRSQRSERAVGRALRAAIEAGRVARDEVLVATKGGYLPFDGGRPRDVRRYVEETFVAPGTLRWEDLVAGCHAMTPRYLEDQLERSRRNLGLETIDVYYLHNLEQQLDEVPRAEFLRRVRAAFERLERAADEGAIGVYGTATWNGYRQPERAPGHLSLAELVAIAREVGGARHRFRVVQLPYNLGMTEARGERNQRAADGRAASLLEAAPTWGIYVMASASVLQGRLTQRLPDDVRGALGGDTDAQRAIQFVRSTPGLGTALVGMKRVEHVEENAGVVGRAPAPDAVTRLFR